MDFRISLRSHIASSVIYQMDRRPTQALMDLFCTAPNSASELLLRCMSLLQETGQLTNYVYSAEELQGPFDVGGLVNQPTFIDLTDDGSAVNASPNTSSSRATRGDATFPPTPESISPRQGTSSNTSTQASPSVGSLHIASLDGSPFPFTSVNNSILNSVSDGQRSATSTNSNSNPVPQKDSLFAFNPVPRLSAPDTTSKADPSTTSAPTPALLPPFDPTDPLTLLSHPIFDLATFDATLAEFRAMHSANMTHISCLLGQTPHLLNTTESYLDLLLRKFDGLQQSAPTSSSGVGATAFGLSAGVRTASPPVAVMTPGAATANVTSGPAAFGRSAATEVARKALLNEVGKLEDLFAPEEQVEALLEGVKDRVLVMYAKLGKKMLSGKTVGGAGNGVRRGRAGGKGKRGGDAAMGKGVAQGLGAAVQGAAGRRKRVSPEGDGAQGGAKKKRSG